MVRGWRAAGMRKSSLAESTTSNLRSPIGKGGTLFRAHKLRVDDGKITVTPTRANLLYSLAVFLAPGILVFGGLSSLEKEPAGAWVTLVLGIGGLCFGLVLLLRVWGTRLIFDKKFGRMTKTGVFGGKKDSISFMEFAELQILEELCRTGGKSRQHFFSYELAIVTKDKSKILITDHGNKDKIQEDAEALAKFLGIPVTFHASLASQSPDSPNSPVS